MSIRTYIETFKNSYNCIKYLLDPFSRTLRLCLDIVTNTRLRHEMISGIIFKNNYFQQSTYTFENRYPTAFAECKKFLEQKQKQLRLLSFGCSTGEEVRTLGEYLPEAIIIGIDINPWCIKQCIKHNTSIKHSFYSYLSNEFEQLYDFDAIFCMAVFQKTINRTNDLTSINSDFNFKVFEETIEKLDAKLIKGGLFVIDHADFSFEETNVAKRYRPLNFDKNKVVRYRPLFNQKNIKISDTAYLYRVFEKIY